jgi:molybdate transport system substrate-binding protein
MASSSGEANAIKVLCAGAMSEIIRQLAAEFERTTDVGISADFTRSGLVKDRVLAGEAVDVAITTQAAIEDLLARKEVVLDSVAIVARSGIGVAVQAGRPKPEIGSTESFGRALRDAKSIAYADPATGSPSANYLVGLLDRLGMAVELKPKTHLVGAAGGHAVVVCDVVAEGKAELGIQQIAEIVAVAGVDFVGPLPPELQHMTVFSAAVAARARHAGSAREFVRFITAAAARPVLAAHGMEPP